MLTLEQLKSLPPNTVFAKGITINDPKGVYMTSYREGDEMIWVAKRGGIHDWCIYIYWEEAGEEYCLSNGDKVMSKDNIKKLVPCNDEAFNMYRF